MTTTASVSSQQRYNNYRRCPICNGHANYQQGKGKRCAGFLSSDGKYAYCTREEHAGALEPYGTLEPASFLHILNGPCKCGTQHGTPLPGATNGHKPYTKSAPAEKEDVYGRIVATYSYHDEHGRLAYQAVRYEPKKFRQRQPDSTKKDGWAWTVRGVTLVPYHLPELMRSAPDALVFIPEGEKDVHSLEHIGLVATTNVAGALKWLNDYNRWLKGRHVVILPDNDDKGRQHADMVAGSLAGVAASIRIVNLPRLPEKGDVSDWLALQGNTKEHLLKFVDLIPPLTPTGGAPSKPATMSLKALMSMQLEPMKWVIPDILPEGLMLLCGKPKLGKSWLGLGIALDTASGGYALGKKQVEQGEVLYLALEDNARRLQSRVGVVLQSDRYKDTGVPDGLEIATEWPRIGEGGIELLEQWIGEHPKARLIIVDTWAKLAPKAQGRQQAQYTEDYDALTPIKKLADTHRIAIVAVHHLRKMGGEDILDQITGSTGLTGACDGFLVLKRERGRFDAELFVTGRDIEDEQNYKLSFDKVGAIWTLEGNAEELARGAVQQAMLDLLRENPDGLTVKEVAEGLNDKNIYTTRTLLNRLVEQGKLEHPHNKYRCVVSVVSVVNGSSSSQCSSLAENDSNHADMTTEGTSTTDTTGTTHSDERRAWLAQFEHNSRVNTPSGPGVILNTTPLSVQLERNRIGVVLDETRQNQYFDPAEIELCTLPLPKRQRTWDGARGQMQA